MKIMHFLTQLLEKTHAPLAEAWARRLFFSPRRKYVDPPNVPDQTSRWLSFERTSGKEGRVRIYYAGDGPAVLLVHGWEGAALGFEAMSKAFINAGFRVVTFDGPAHGTSPGSKTNLIELSRVAQDLGRLSGGFELVVGHSFGGVVAGHAIDAGLKTNALVTIASPASTDYILDQFQSIIGASNRTRDALGKKITQIAKRPTSELALMHFVKRLLSPGLVIHDENDGLVPVENAHEIAKRWPNAHLTITKGLGHSRILRDALVIDQVVEFARQRVDIKKTA